jgi:hypothetical protein
VPAAAACAKHPAGHAIIIFLLFVYLLIHNLVPAAAACVRHPADDASHCYFIIIYHLVPAAAA